MRCYFLRGRRIAGVEILPTGLSDEDAIAGAHTLSLKRKGSFDGFEVWDQARFVHYSAERHSSPEQIATSQSQPASG
jgi:hypothetical protein